MKLKRSEMAIVVWLFERGFVGGHGVKVSHAELAAELGLAKVTVTLALRSLRERGLAWFIEGGDYGHANTYGLTGTGIAVARGHLLGKGVSA